MKTFLLSAALCWCLGFLAPTLTRAGDGADLLHGYGKARWGQSLDGVKAAYPGGVAGGNFSSPDPHALPTGETEYSVYVVDAPEPLKSITFGFQDDQLCKVTLTFSERTAAAIQEGQIADELWNKYFADPALRTSIQAQRISVLVQPCREGRPPAGQGFVRVDKHLAASLASDLIVPPVGKNLEVTYENHNAADNAQAAAKTRRQRAVEEAAGIRLHDIL